MWTRSRGRLGEETRAFFSSSHKAPNPSILGELLGVRKRRTLGHWHAMTLLVLNRCRLTDTQLLGEESLAQAELCSCFSVDTEKMKA